VAGLELLEVRYDSNAFQFWGSEQNARDVPLVSDRSHWTTGYGSYFSSADIDEFERRARKLNDQKKGDQAAFYFRVASGRTRTINKWLTC
jgi:hypothetical protein